MSSMRSQYFATAAGVTASGLASGLVLAYPLLINEHFINKEQGSKIKPASKTPNLVTSQRLTLWNRAYDLGHWCPLFSVLAATGLATTALISNDSSLRRMLGGASALHLSIVPFTLLFIQPVNVRLIDLRKAANEEREVPEAEVESLLSKWTNLHNVRVLLTCAGFVTAVATVVRS